MNSSTTNFQLKKSEQLADSLSLKEPLVSVVIPTYNHAQYVDDAVQSVIDQTYKDYEIIVVDDGSQDNTREVVTQFGSQVRYIWQENQGLSAARNTAIRNAQAETIALLDADDLWEPEFLEKMMSHLDRYSEAAAVYCGFQYINTYGHLIGKPSCRTVPPEQFHKTLICEGNWLVPCAVVFRKRLAEEVGLFDESLRAVEDADMWTRLSALHPFVGLPEILVKYRRHDNNMTKDPERMITANCQRTEKMFGSPEGDPSSWSALKQCAYAKLFRSGARRYLAYGNIAESAHYIERLLKISPRLALSMEAWRELVRVHLPDEHRNDPSAQLDWALAQKNIMQLLSELAIRAPDSAILEKLYSRITGIGFLALADESMRANKLSQAFVWLWYAARNHPLLLFSRSYWGTVGRRIINTRK